MATLNFNDLTSNAENLGKDLLNELTGRFLSQITDPATIDLASRQTAIIASTPVAMIGAPDDVRAQLQNDYDAAVSVLLSLASAQVEDGSAAAAAVQTKVRTFVSEFVATAIKVGVASLVAL